MCAHTALPQATVLAAADQVIGDCQVSICDGAGGETTQPDDSDLPPSDGNSCHRLSCQDGSPHTSVLGNGEVCNNGGVCKAGACSDCENDADCTGIDDCVVKRITCAGGQARCLPTDLPIANKVCGAGKTCNAGTCESCAVGMLCQASEPCRVSRVTSCNPRQCQDAILTGEPCGEDAQGRPMVCSSTGECGYECREGACASSSDPCKPSRWSCSAPDGQAQCVPTTAPDGTECGPSSVCHAGGCARTALVNGDFSQGLTGWTLTGNAPMFVVFNDTLQDGRRSITSYVEGYPGGPVLATGTVSQQFKVPDDALWLRFSVHGGSAHVRLRDASNQIIEDVTGDQTSDHHMAVSWDLTARRGQMLTIALEDDTTMVDWGFVGMTGVDVIRQVDSPIKDDQFDNGLMGWEQSGDAAKFVVFSAFDFSHGTGITATGVDAFGKRRTVTTAIDASTPLQCASAMGTLSQTFSVPMDAVALRFLVHGGNTGRVMLYDGSAIVNAASPENDNSLKKPVSWDLTAYRGKSLRLTIVDNYGDTEWDFVGCSSFDLITTYNGP